MESRNLVGKTIVQRPKEKDKGKRKETKPPPGIQEMEILFDFPFCKCFRSPSLASGPVDETCPPMKLTIQQAVSARLTCKDTE